MAVRQLGRSGLVAACRQRDRLDQHAVGRASDASVCATPVVSLVAWSRSLGCHAEPRPHIVIIQRCLRSRREHQPTILPPRPRCEPVLSLLHPLLPQRLAHRRGSTSVRRDFGVSYHSSPSLPTAITSVPVARRHHVHQSWWLQQVVWR